MTDNKTLSVGDVVKKIREDLNLPDREVGDGEALMTESYVASPKEYRLSTEFLSEKSKDRHMQLYEKAVEALNQTSAELDTADRDVETGNHSRFRSLKVDEAYNLNAVYLHELFFANISDVHSNLRMDSLSFMRLERDFGTFDDWQFDFVACAMASRGWAVCAYNTYLKRYVNMIIDSDDTGVLIGCYPVIVLDVFEHSYYKDYMTDRKSYVFAMMKELNWDIVEERFKRSERINEVLK